MNDLTEPQEKDPVPGAGNRFVFLVIGATVVFVLLSMLLEQIGIPGALVVALAALFVCGGAAIPGLVARTAMLSEWLFARRSAGPITIGLANAAILLPGPVFLFLPGWFFADDPKGSAMLAALLAAAFVGGIVIHPMLRGWASGSPLDIVSARFGSVWIKLLLAAVLGLACVLLLWAELAVLGRIAAPVFGASANATMIVAAILIGIAVLPGGLLGVLRTSALAYVFLATAFLAAPVWIAATVSGFPVPQVVYGAAALADVMELERQLAGIGIPALGQVVNDTLFEPFSVPSSLALFGFVAIGLAVLPAAIGTQQSARSTGASRKSVVWTLMLVGLVVSAAPAAGVYAKLAMYNATLGLTSGEVEQAAPWFAFWGAESRQGVDGHALVMLCGEAIISGSAAVEACGGNPDHSITPGDLSIQPEFAALGLAQTAGLPFVFLLLSAMAIIAASLATANATLFAGASLFTSLGSGEAADTVQPQMRRLFTARLGGLALLVVALLLATASSSHPFEIFLWAMAVLVGLFVPALVACLWTDSLRREAAVAGLCAGAVALGTLGAGPVAFALPGLSSLPASVNAGLAALMVNVAVIAVISVLRRGRPLGDRDFEQYRLPDLASRRIQQRHGLVE